MKFMNEEERYTALCAYVLGEAGPVERAAIEAELAESAELRAQRDELEATIGLVRTSLGGEERLSDTAHDQVLRAAQARRPRWQLLRTPWLAAAAGICAVAFGWYVLDAGEPGARRRMPVPDEAVARLERKDERAKVGENVLRDGIAAGEEFALPYDAPAATAPEQDAAGQRRAQNEIMKSAVDERVAQNLGENEQTLVDALRRLGYAGDAEPAPAERQMRFRQLGYAGDDADGSSPPNAKLAAKSAGTHAGPGDTVPPARQSDADAKLGIDHTRVQKVEEPVLKDRSTEVIAVGGGAGGKFGNRAAGRSGAGGRSTNPGPAGPSATSVPMNPSVPMSGGGQAPLEDHAMLAAIGYAGEDAYDDKTGSDNFAIGRASRFSEVSDRTQPLSPEQREKAIELECRRILEHTRRRPNEQPSAMYFRYWGDNPLELTALDALSTFGVDVDTASYALVRNYLRQGMIPPREAVRTEEFVNYFAPDVPAPTEGTFAIKTELAPSRYGGDPARWMLEVAVRGREVAREERKPLSLTFVVDTSGSMKEGNRIEMVKHALRLLLAELDGNDTVAIVAFSNEARLVLPSTPASQRGLIESAIHPLAPDGSTNAEAGLLMGYEAALTALRAGANNRVVFLSDGVANVGETDQDRITAEVARHRKQGIYLNTIGVGMGNHNDALLEQLANRGDGVCNYIDSPAEARRALVDNFTGQFEAIARDVKVQVEFDPAQVFRWRLLGYENRAIADKDFRNDAIDAGELGAGHQVVALYEIERTLAAADAPLATVRLRWKPPFEAGMGKAQLEAGEEASEVEQPIFARGTSWEGTDAGYKRAVLVAQFAEILRRSSHARGDSLDDLLRDTEQLLSERADEELREFFDLVRQSRELILRSLPACDELCQTVDEVRRWNLRQAELELMRVERDQKELEELARRNAELEQRIRELVRRKYTAQPR